jgi:hypothetical protein
MFRGSLLARRLRLRRQLRRSAARCSRSVETHVALLDLDDMLAELCIWATGMPWVVERPSGAEDTLRLFVLDCPLLSCHEPWFAILAIDDDTDSGPWIVVVLPDEVACRAEGMDTAGIERIGTRRSIITIGLPTSEEELHAVQLLLEMAYGAAFEPSN